MEIEHWILYAQDFKQNWSAETGEVDLLICLEVFSKTNECENRNSRSFSSTCMSLDKVDNLEIHAEIDGGCDDGRRLPEQESRGLG